MGITYVANNAETARAAYDAQTDEERRLTMLGSAFLVAIERQNDDALFHDAYDFLALVMSGERPPFEAWHRAGENAAAAHARHSRYCQSGRSEKPGSVTVGGCNDAH